MCGSSPYLSSLYLSPNSVVSSIQTYQGYFPCECPVGSQGIHQSGLCRCAAAQPFFFLGTRQIHVETPKVKDQSYSITAAYDLDYIQSACDEEILRMFEASLRTSG